MKLTRIYKILPIIIVYLSVGCVPDVNPEEDIVTTTGTTGTTDTSTTATTLNINVPANFDYSTHRSVQIDITDDSRTAKYDIFVHSTTDNYFGTETYEDESGEIVTEEVYREDLVNKLVYTGVAKSGRMEVALTLPKYATDVYLRRRDNFKYSSKLVQIVNNRVVYNHATDGSRSTRNNVEDILYCVNGSGELFQVDPLNGDMTMISEMPMGSYTAAIDQENLVMYSIGRSSPYPLMKYDIQADEWSTVANMGFGGPRLDYNINDNLLYFSNKDYLRSIDPITGVVLQEWDINGLHNTNGGDLAFAEDGTLFLASFSGLYRCDFNGTSYDAVRISADNLPFMPTSMTFDSNGELWLANSSGNSDLIVMDTTTGGWQYNWGTNANNGTSFGRTINDLTTLRIYSATPDTTDSDGDGIVDSEDAFPEEADKAFEVFTPSKYGNGTIAFEDLWPTYGDYDFNDLAFTYRAIAILNSDNLAVQLDFICYVKSAGAGYTNGFGIEIEGLDPSLVESVNGTAYTYDYINLNANGTEAEQDNAVIIFTDNSDNFLTERTVSIKLTQPISTETLGSAPFNPFIIINQERHKEVHLPFKNKTSLGQNITINEGINSDPDGNFISDNGLPWGISIIHDFKVPRENVSIDRAYNFFITWATSGGVSHQDWYKDNPGYRNTNYLDN